MTVRYEDGAIIAEDGNGDGTRWEPEEEVTSLKLKGTTVVVNTREGHHYEYDGLTGVFDHERSSNRNTKR